ncbi:MAG: type II toxin-antitoxin system RelE/ParE family toxin [Pyrinomonadaceae bacterium]
MKYKVTIALSAEADILASFEWGVRNWGVTKARSWAIALRRVIKDRLAQHPKSCPLAPDLNFDRREVRHLVMDRCRVLFEIDRRTVRVLAVRGPFHEPKK